MTTSDKILLLLLVLVILTITYFIAEEHHYRKWLRDLEQPVDSLVIKKRK